MGYYGGLTINGSVRFGNAGQTVSGIGDINGDGIDDAIVSTGERSYSNDYYTQANGAAYVIFGDDSGNLPTNISLADIDGSNGFKITAPTSGFYGQNTYGFGTLVANLGDVNGDGIDDLAIGGATFGFYYQANETNTFVLFGKDTGFEAEVALDDTLEGTDGFVIQTEAGNEVSRIEAAGDLNGDGINDILINQNTVGGYYGEGLGISSVSPDIAAYAIFGGAGLGSTGVVNVADLDGTNGFGIAGGSVDLPNFFGGEVPASSALSSGVAAAGDINGDGFSDLALQLVNGYSSGGGVYDEEGNFLYFQEYSYSLLSQGFVLFGEETNAAVKSGPDDGTEVFWDNASDFGEFDNIGDLGYAGIGEITFAALGDVNGDGYDDVGISTTNRVLLGEFSPVAEDGDNAYGVMGIIFGGPDGIDTDGDGPLDGANLQVSLAARDEDGNPVNSPDVLVVNSRSGIFEFGQIMAAAGDINGDGIDDFLVSDPRGTNIDGVSYYGETFLVFGKDSEAGEIFPAVLDLDNLAQSEIDETFYRFVQTENRFANFGTSVAAAGDINGDGFDDLILGASGAQAAGLEGQYTGQAYIVFGGTASLEATDAADGANDNTINIANLPVDVVTGALPIVVSVANFGASNIRQEGDAGDTVFTFRAQRTGDLTEAVSFTYEVRGSGFSPADATDFSGGALPTGTVNFRAGEATADVDILVNGDTTIESDEDFVFVITDVANTGPSAVSIGVNSSFATIDNDDFPASIRISSSSVTEGGNLVFTLSRFGDLTSTISVDFDVSGASFRPVSAADISDVVADGVSLGGGLGQTGSITWAAGETSKQIIVSTVDDTLIESRETVQIQLSNLTASGPANLSNSVAFGYIDNNDFAPEIFVQGGGSFLEGSTVGGSTPVTFEIVRRGDTSGATEVTYDLNPVPSVGNFFAADSNDVDGFLPSFGSVVRFEDGESVKQVVVNINHDGIIEPRESFELRITQVESFNSSTYTIIRPNATATIINDDGRPPEIPPGVEADVFGDPHIVSLDGLGYDFQAVGEYVLVESTIVDDPRDFQVQVRFEPLPGSDLVSVTTRMAVEVAGKVVEIDALNPAALLIDGLPLTPEQASLGSIDLDGNGFPDVFFNAEMSEFFVVLNDLNEQLMLKNMDGVLNICVFLSDAEGGHANNVQGLMGNANGDASDDLALRDGSTTFTDPTFEELYVTYAQSWAVTSDERNFSDGTDAGNFPEGFPAAKISIDDLPAAVLAAAVLAVDAAGITDPIIRESAILDFALTGDDSFVQGAAGLAANPTEEVEVTNAPVIPLTIGLSPVETAVSEDDGNPNTLAFTFWRIGDDSEAVVIDYAIGGDVDAADLVSGTALTGQITIPAGQGSATLNVGVLNDDTTELNEKLTVSITGNDKGALVASVKGTTLIETDDFAPVAADDFFATSELDVLSGNVLDPNPTDADSDANGDVLTVISAQNASGGGIRTDGFQFVLPSGATMRMNTDGSFEFNPTGFFNSTSDYDRLAAGETLNETFTYTISDGHGGTDTATATIMVTGVNDAPVAVIDQYAPTEDSTVSGNILTDTTGGRADSDAEGDALTVTRINGQLLADIDEDDTTDGAQITVGDGGKLTIFSDGAFTFDTNGAYEQLGNAAGQLVSKLQSVQYTIADIHGAEDSNALRFSVQGVNDGPVANDDSGSTDFQTAVNIDVLLNDTDAEGDDLDISAASSDNGEVVIEDNGTLTFTPADGFSGEALISYTVVDAGGLESTATVRVDVAEPENRAPVARNSASSIQEDGSANFGILSLISDADGDALSIDSLSVTAGATVETTSDTSFRITGDRDFNGPVTVTYSVTDGELTSNFATIEIAIDAVNDAPTLESTGPFTVDENTTAVGTISASDVDSTDLSFSIIGGADGALFSIDETSGALSFNSAPDFEAPASSDGDNSFEVQIAVSDGDLSVDGFVFVDVADVVEDTGPNVVNGNDVVFEQLTGTDGEDEIHTGGGQFDYIFGGGGADTFIIDQQNNSVREMVNIFDFDVSEDTLDLQGRDVLFNYSLGTTTFVMLGNDFDTIAVYGASSFDDINFA